MKYFKARKVAYLKINVEGEEKPYFMAMAPKMYSNLCNAFQNKDNKEELRISYGYTIFVITERVGSFEWNVKRV